MAAKFILAELIHPAGEMAGERMSTVEKALLNTSLIHLAIPKSDGHTSIIYDGVWHTVKMPFHVLAEKLL